MKNAILTAGLAALSLPYAAGAATLEMNLAQPLTVHDTQGQAAELAPGPVTVETEGKGWYFDSKIVLRQGEKSYFVKVPRASFVSDADLEVPAGESGQPFGVVGKIVEPTLVKKWKAIERVACTAPGYCRTCEEDENGAHVRGGCATKFSQSCRYDQEAVVEKSLYKLRFSLELRGAEGALLGQATGPAGEKVETRKEKELQKCGERRLTYSRLEEARRELEASSEGDAGHGMQAN